MTTLEREWHWRKLIEKGMIISFFQEYRQTPDTSVMYEWICKNLDKNTFDSEYNYYYRFIAYSISKVKFESNLHLVN